MTHQKKRIVLNKIILTICAACMIAATGILLWILSIVLYKGFSALDFSIFINSAAPAGSANGGLKNALIGHFLLVVTASSIGIPIGLLAGTFISEYASKRLAKLTRGANELLASAPSIVVGAFAYAVLVQPFGHFSGWAGAAALAFIMIPIVTSAADSMLALVSPMQREASAALGATRSQTIAKVVWRGAKTGLITGALLAIARISGETAPLLFTAFNNNYASWDMSEPTASLSVAMFNYATSPYEDWQRLGWAAAVILLLFTLSVNLIGKITVGRNK